MKDGDKPVRNDAYEKIVKDNIVKIFGESNDDVLEEIMNSMTWLELKSGEILIKEGDVGDSLYFVLSGRLAATKKDSKGHQTKIGDVIRGDIVGEMSIFTDDPRYASIIAIRECILVELSKEAFKKIIAENASIAFNVTKLIINRAKKNTSHLNRVYTVNLCFVPIHDSLDFNSIISEIHSYSQHHLKTFHIDEAVVKQHGYNLNESQNSFKNTLENRKIIQWLNNMETQNDYLFFSCTNTPSPLTDRFLRQADQIVLFADATQDFQLTEAERKVMEMKNVNISLVLVHPKGTKTPKGTRNWLDIRPKVHQHYHVRQENNKDIHRLARILTQRSTGLVLAGGGAKGFAHLGVYKALLENNIHIDYLGGTSAGAMMAFLISSDLPADNIINIARKATTFKPSSDVSLFPLISLVNGINIKKMVRETVKEIGDGQDLDISDSWIPMFTVASNFTKYEQTVFHKGSHTRTLLASSAIPGIFPPIIIDGDLFVDGGSFNNFPVDIMKKLQIQNIIGVDFMLDKVRTLTIKDLPTNRELLKTKIFGKSNKYKLPSIGSIIINSTLMYSNARRFENKNYLDLHFNPNVSKYGITAWTDFDKIVNVGYKYAKDLLSKMNDEELEKFRR